MPRAFSLLPIIAISASLAGCVTAQEVALVPPVAPAEAEARLTAVKTFKRGVLYHYSSGCEGYLRGEPEPSLNDKQPRPIRLIDGYVTDGRSISDGFKYREGWQLCRETLPEMRKTMAYKTERQLTLPEAVAVAVRAGVVAGIRDSRRLP